MEREDRRNGCHSGQNREDCAYLMPGCNIFAFSLKSSLSELSRGPLYLPRFWSPDAHTRTQEARCTGARFAPGRGRGRGVCRSRPANTQYRFHHSTAPSFTFYNSRQPAFPSTHPHQTRRTPPTPILQAILTGPGVGRCRKPGPRAARRAECVGVLFDHLLSLVHDPSAQGSRPRTTNPSALVLRPPLSLVHAHDQSDGSTRPPYDLYVALRRGCRLAGVKHSSCCP
jgi:hypothetical protein